MMLSKVLHVQLVFRHWWGMLCYTLSMWCSMLLKVRCDCRTDSWQELRRKLAFQSASFGEFHQHSISYFSKGDAGCQLCGYGLLCCVTNETKFAELVYTIFHTFSTFALQTNAPESYLALPNSL